MTYGFPCTHKTKDTTTTKNIKSLLIYETEKYFAILFNLIAYIFCVYCIVSPKHMYSYLFEENQ